MLCDVEEMGERGGRKRVLFFYFFKALVCS